MKCPSPLRRLRGRGVRNEGAFADHYSDLITSPKSSQILPLNLASCISRMGKNWVGPVLMRYGTEAQLEKHLPPIRAGLSANCRSTSATTTSAGWI